MSRADIQYIPLTTDPSRRIRDLTPELTQANIWLAGVPEGVRAVEDGPGGYAGSDGGTAGPYLGRVHINIRKR